MPNELKDMNNSGYSGGAGGGYGYGGGSGGSGGTGQYNGGGGYTGYSRPGQPGGYSTPWSGYNQPSWVAKVSPGYTTGGIRPAVANPTNIERVIGIDNTYTDPRAYPSGSYTSPYNVGNGYYGYAPQSGYYGNIGSYGGSNPTPANGGAVQHINPSTGDWGYHYTNGGSSSVGKTSTQNNPRGYGNGGANPGFAEGGQTPVNKPFMVGEQGPEMMMMNRPGTVMSNPATKAALAMSKNAALIKALLGK